MIRGRIVTRDLHIDFRQLLDLEQKFNELAESELNEFVRLAVIELGKFFLRRVVYRTPVDSGRLKKGWRLTRVIPRKDGYEIHVINPVEYGVHIEEGHWTRNKDMGERRWIEGFFMMKNTELEMEKEAPKIIERRLRKFLRDKLNA